MKKEMVISACAVISIAFFIHCRNTKLTKNNNHSTRSETSTMNRSKTPSGLEYEIIKEGNGTSPQKGNTVIVHYTGWLNENDNPGQKFDSSLDRNQSFSFKIGIGQVIKGW